MTLIPPLTITPTTSMYMVTYFLVSYYATLHHLVLHDVVVMTYSRHDHDDMVNSLVACLTTRDVVRGAM